MLNRRIAQKVNGVVTSYVYDNWNLIEERPTDGRQPHCYLFGGASNELVVSFGSGYPNYWYFQDGRGNTSHLTDNEHVVIERYTYDLGGRVSYSDGNNNPIPSTAFDNRFLFAGAILLPETQVYDMRHRIYYPRWGRFLQTDAIGFKGDSSNLYRYCHNDAVNRTDPLGLEDEIFGPGQLESAVRVARRQVEAASLDPNRKSAIALIRRKGDRYPTPEKYYPSKMVPVLIHGKGYKVGPTIDGVVSTIGGQTRELESISPELGRIAASVHGHNDKRGPNTKTPGLAMPGWSDRDLELRNVDRMDESNFGKWYSRRNGREVPSDGTSRQKSTDTSAASGSSNGTTGSYLDMESFAPSARDVDLAHQATGVPSLGQEAVNFAPGRP